MYYLDFEGCQFTKGLDGNREALVITSHNLTNSLQFLELNSWADVYLPFSGTSSFTNVDFLRNLEFIKSLSIGGVLQSAEAIYTLSGLRSLTLSDGAQIIDFRNLSQLTELRLQWHPKMTNLDLLSSLELLHIDRFSPKYGTFEGFGLPNQLITLEISSSNIQNFEGLCLPALKNLGLAYCSKLFELNHLETQCPSLEKLTFEKCSKISNYEPLVKLKQLNDLEIRYCAEIPSLLPFKNLVKLNRFNFYGTNIGDGDLSICDKLACANFKDAKSFNRARKNFSYLI
jgi:hypothetical protein